ncbi:MAG: glycosyltransferase family 4 protein [Gemmatimonadota bacterium]
MRILHVLAPAPFGGLESVVEALAAEQTCAGHEVHVAAVLEPDGTTHPMLRALQANGVYASAVRVGARAYRRERALVRETCARLRPAVVHTHGYRTDVLHGPVARALGIPTVSTAHGFIGGDWKNRIYEHLQRRAYRHCSAVVAVSRPMAAYLVRRGVPAGRVHCIPNAWADATPFVERADARVALGIHPATYCIGFVGRLSREKGPDVFVEALARVNPAVTALVIGDGRMRDALELRTRQLGISGTVRFAGSVENAGRFMKAFDAVVLSSRTEGTPVVLLEAMAAGVPVVATTVGGIPDAVSQLEAWLVPPEDPPALAAALREIIADPDAARTLAARATQRLRAEFGAGAWVERYDDVYRACGAAPRLAASA